MKLFNKAIAIVLCVALVITTMPVDAAALRPTAYKVGPWHVSASKKNIAFRDVDVEAAIKEAIVSGNAVSIDLRDVIGSAWALRMSPVQYIDALFSLNIDTMADFFTRSLEDIDTEYVKQAIAEYIKDAATRRDLQKGLEFILNEIERSPQRETLSNRRFVILLSKDDAFEQAEALGYGGAGIWKDGSIYMHLDMLRYAEKGSVGQLFKKSAIKHILQHEDADIERGRHEYQSAAENTLINLFWSRFYHYQKKSFWKRISGSHPEKVISSQSKKAKGLARNIILNEWKSMRRNKIIFPAILLFIFIIPLIGIFSLFILGAIFEKLAFIMSMAVLMGSMLCMLIGLAVIIIETSVILYSSDIGSDMLDRLKELDPQLSLLIEKRLELIGSWFWYRKFKDLRKFSSGKKGKSLYAGESLFHDDGRVQVLSDKTIEDLEIKETVAAMDMTKTETGKKRLIRLFTHNPIGIEEIKARQDAVSELVKDEQLYSSLSEGFESIENEVEPLTHLILSPPVNFWGVKLMKFLTLSAIAISFILFLITFNTSFLFFPAGLFILCNLFWIGSYMHMHKKDFKDFERMSEVFARIEHLKNILKEADSDYLKEIAYIFSSLDDAEHPMGLYEVRELAKNIEKTGLGDIIHFRGLERIERLKAKMMERQDELLTLISAVAELDVYLGLAGHGKSRYFSLPKASKEKAPALEIKKGHHPILLFKGRDSGKRGSMVVFVAEDSVANDVALSKGKNFNIVTGANMEGKSTYIRMAGILLLMAQTGSYIPCESMEWTPMRVNTHIRIRDMLSKGKSYFDVETDDMLAIIHDAEGGETPTLSLMDEILQGTDPRERIAAERAIVDYLRRLMQLYILATHDRELASLEQETSGAVYNTHMDGYARKEGPAQLLNALKIMHQKGFPYEIIEGAYKRLNLKPPAHIEAKEPDMNLPKPEKREYSLREGDRLYGEEARYDTLDEATINDLGIFEHGAGLYYLMDEAATVFGENRLKWLLTHPYMDKEEIRQRQEAIRELADDEGPDSLRERFFRSLEPLSHTEELSQAIKQSELERTFHKSWIHDLTDMIPFSILLTSFFAIIYLSGLLPLEGPGALISLASALVLVVSLMLHTMYNACKYNKAEQKPKAGVTRYDDEEKENISMGRDESRRAFLAYKKLFIALEDIIPELKKKESPALLELAEILEAITDPRHPDSIVSFVKATKKLHLQPGFTTTAINHALLYDNRTIARIERSFFANKENILKVLSAFGELDAFMSLAEIPNLYDGYNQPRLRKEKGRHIEIVEGHHPLLHRRAQANPKKNRSISNPVTVTGDDHFKIITGPNMEGKSTYLRMVGLLALLAQTGAYLPAKEMVFNPIKVRSSIGTLLDSTKKGKSYFDTETDRILELIILAVVDPEMFILLLLDEIVKGTNRDERLAAEMEIGKFLAGKRAGGIIATHERELAKLETEEHIPGISNAHLDFFAYREGPAKFYNAIKIMRDKGYPPQIIKRACELLGISEDDLSGPIEEDLLGGADSTKSQSAGEKRPIVGLPVATKADLLDSGNMQVVIESAA